MHSEKLLNELKHLIHDFEKELKKQHLRKKVLVLVSCFNQLRELGKSLEPLPAKKSARDRILQYFLKYPRLIINGDELLVISGIQEYARRIRELKVEFGWSIVSGKTARIMSKEGDLLPEGVNVSGMKPNDYILLSDVQDRDAAFRWKLANEIRKEKIGVREKLLKYFRKNINKPVTGEELQYIANNKTEWARRVRELRTEFGWPIITRNTGRPELEVGVYVLEADRQSPEHDRKIPDTVKGKVLQRDGYQCTQCNWNHDKWNKSDPRHLELHHVKPHAQGGDNSAENLITLCTVCHDDIHRSSK